MAILHTYMECVCGSYCLAIEGYGITNTEDMCLRGRQA